MLLSSILKDGAAGNQHDLDVSGPHQSPGVLEAEWIEGLKARAGPHHGPGSLFRVVRFFDSNDLWTKDLFLSRVIGFSVVNLISFSFDSIITTNVLGALGSISFQCILGSRMFFNLREAAEQGVNVGTNWASYSVTGIRFGQSTSEDSELEFRYAVPPAS